MLKKTNREPWIDYSKGVGILLVVYGHVLVGVKGAGIGDWKNFFYFSHNIIYSFHMPLFFILAGLHVRQSLSKRGIKKFISNKLSVILYPYLVWSILTGSIQIILANYVNSQITPLDLLSILYRPLPNQHYWFLYALFLMYLTFSLFAAGTKRYAATSFLIFTIVLSLLTLNTGIRIIDKFSLNAIYFALGIFLDEFFLSREFLKKPSFVLIVLAVPAFFGLEFYYWAMLHSTSQFPQIVFALPGTFIVIIVSKYMVDRNIFPFLAQLGYYSMYIYLAHGLFGSAIRIFLSKFLAIDSLIIHVTTGLMFSTILPVILYKYSIRMNFPYLFRAPHQSSSKNT